MTVRLSESASNPGTQSRMRAARRLEVIVEGHDSRHMPTRTTISNHATEWSALQRVCEILRQWADAQGTIQVGTKVSIVDRNDGGKVFFAEYLGYEPDLLSGR